MKTFRRVGDRRVASYDASEFSLRFASDGEEDSVMYLPNLYAEYCQAPKRERAKMLRRTCVALARRLEAPTDFEDVKPDLLPTIRARSFLEVMRLGREIDGPPSDQLPSLPLSEHLVVCLVYDLPTSMQLVNQEQLQEWGVSLYEAAEIAKQNLAERELLKLLFRWELADQPAWRVTVKRRQ